jgi:hypothetical protein
MMNRRALLNTRKFSCAFNLQALPANPNSQPPRGGPGAMHMGCAADESGMEGGFSAP